MTTLRGAIAFVAMSLGMFASAAAVAGAQSYEATFSIGGANNLRGISSEAFYSATIAFPDESIEFPIATSTQRVGEGFTWGATVDVSMGRYFSHALSFTSSGADYYINFTPTLGEASDLLDAPMTIRVVNYAFNAYARPTGARVRPFAFIGPGLVSMRLSDALKKGRRFNLAFRELGVLERAYELGRIPPLEGGTWYHWGWVYGGGVKVRLSERLLCRIEYTELRTRQIDFINESKTILEDGLDSAVIEIPTGSFRRGALLIGAGISF